MDHEMTIDDAANVVRVIGDERTDDPDRDVSALARAARRLLHQVDELAGTRLRALTHFLRRHYLRTNGEREDAHHENSAPERCDSWVNGHPHRESHSASAGSIRNPG